MKKAAALQAGSSGIQILEEAAHLLRLAPPAVLFFYYAGGAPFVLAFIFFWSEMSRSAYAEERCTGLSLGLALLFVWMKTCQAVFARSLRAILGRRNPPSFSPRRLARIAAAQSFLQPTGFLLLPLSLIITLPFAWVFAFYQNLTTEADGDDGSAKLLISRAARQAALWPKQNHTVLCALALFSAVLFINCLLASVMVPHLVKMLLGIESSFTQSWSALLNTTLLASVAGVAYLCVDPLVKAAYTIRSFQGESIGSGEDLMADLSVFERAVPRAASRSGKAPRLALLLAATGILWGAGLAAQEDAAPVEPEEPAAHADPRFSPEELDQAISQTLEKSEYAWRLPRKRPEDDAGREKGAITRFFESVKEWIENASRWVGGKVESIYKWIRKTFFGGDKSAPAGQGSAWMSLERALLYLLLAAVAGLLAALLWRLWRQKSPRRAAEAIPIAGAVDVGSENVTADQLPEDGWLKMARELLERGEARLAIRALYLAGLARLGERGLVALAKFKSNSDYARELGRRAHAFPEILDAFRGNAGIFDRVWYGVHAVTADMIADFKSNLERLREA